jgi:hypothetical protein
MIRVACNIGFIGNKMAAQTDTDGERYPACLERPDLGGRVRVRAPKTVAEYRKRYIWLRKRTARFQRTNVKTTTVADVAERLFKTASTLRPSSYRQYRAAIQQELRDLWDAKKISLDEVERIAESMILTRDSDAPSPYASKRSPLRTSAGRAKGIGQGKAAALSNIAAARESPSGRNLADHFRFGPQFGLRNFEWFGAVLDGTKLKVPCGKYSVPNRRGIAEYRTLLAQDLDASELARLAEFLGRLRSEMRRANGRGDLVLRRQSYLLRAIRDDAGAPRVTLRTVRHQFTANLRKAGYSREERAAALGHAAADTSDDHYGKPNRGWKGLRRWIELPAELTRQVRPGAKTASKLRRNLPLTRSEWVARGLPAPGI